MTTYEHVIHETALRAGGKIPTLLKTVEELGELQRAISRYIVSADVVNTDNLHEEFADVSIMLERLHMLLDDAEIESWRDYKLDRIAEKLGVTVTVGAAPPNCQPCPTPPADACDIDPHPATPTGARYEKEGTP